jgi:hypothetical protein
MGGEVSRHDAATRDTADHIGGVEQGGIAALPLVARLLHGGEHPKAKRGSARATARQGDRHQQVGVSRSGLLHLRLARHGHLFFSKTDLALSRKVKRAQGSLPQLGEQIELLMPDKDVQAWEYSVMVANSVHPLRTFGQLYRDRADCENGFDELKNQWGWGGFTTQDIERCQSSVRAVALVYNW